MLLYKLGQKFPFTGEDGIGVEFHVQPYLLDVDYCQTILSCLDINFTNRIRSCTIKDSKLQFWTGTQTDHIQMFQSQCLVNCWSWLRVRMSLVGTKFTSNIQQLHRLAEKAPKP
jgi:hypothetical protein